MENISCRAQVHADCLDGKPEASTYDVGEGETQQDDGTWDGESVVCDACYVALMPLTPSGRALTHELPAAIAKARGEPEYIGDNLMEPKDWL